MSNENDRLSKPILTRRDFLKFGGGFLTFIVGNQALRLTDPLANPIYSALTEGEHDNYIADLQNSGIDYIPRFLNQQDRNSWGTYDVEQVSTSDQPTESLDLVKALRTARNFFPQSFWNNKSRLGRTEILPITFRNEGYNPAYLYRERENGNDTIAMELPSAWHSTLVTGIAGEIPGHFHTKVKPTLLAFTHMLMARNRDMAKPLIDKFGQGGSEYEPFYIAIDRATQVLTGSPEYVQQDDTLQEVGNFYDLATQSNAGTYGRFIEKAASVSRSTLYEKTAPEYFGWK